MAGLEWSLTCETVPMVSPTSRKGVFCGGGLYACVAHACLLVPSTVTPLLAFGTSTGACRVECKCFVEFVQFSWNGLCGNALGEVLSLAVS